MSTLFTILAVDDNPINLLIINEILGKEYAIIKANNGKEAIAIAKSSIVDLILMDIMMPEIDGLTACSILKEDEQTNEIPVIFITAKADHQSIISGLSLGAVDYITKPFNKIELLARVKNHLSLVFSKKMLKHELAERIRVQNILINREEILSNITNNITDIIVKLDSDFKIEYVTPSFTNTTKIPVFQAIGEDFFTYLHPSDVESFKKTLTNLNQNANLIIVQHRLAPTSEDIVWIENRIKILHNQNNDITGYVLNLINITQTKLANDQIQYNLLEQKLLAQISASFINHIDFEQNLSEVLATISDTLQIDKIAIYNSSYTYAGVTFEYSKIPTTQNTDNYFLYYNEKSEFYSQINNSSHILLKKAELVNYPDCEILLEQINVVLILPVHIINQFYGFIAAGSLNINYFNNNNIEFFKTITNIISKAFEINRYNLELTKNQTQLSNIFDNSGDAIIVSSVNGKIVNANKKATELFGYEKSELFEKDFINLVAQSSHNTLVDLLHDVKDIRVALKFEDQLIKSNNELFFAESTMSFINIGDEFVYLIIIRDITDRKNLERTIVNTIIQTEEKERTRFAKDLHDGMGAILSSINIYINMILSEEMDRAELETNLTYTKGLVDQAMQSAKEIANNLRPTILNRFGIEASIKSLIEPLEKSEAFTINFTTTNFSGISDKDLELIIFRIINEFFNNTIKHAEATQINLNLAKEENNIIINYSDNGIGFDLDIVLNTNKTGMGVNNIITRTKSLNGKCEIITAQQSGTQIKVTIPDKKIL